ncbi:MAG TPA: zinc ribbon domain-containing protein [Rhizomicrobium sp.]
MDRSPEPVIVRRYKGHQSNATEAFQKEAQTLSAQGYYPAGQSWAPGTWGCGLFLIGILLCFIGIGVLILIYMLLVKPDGTLTVTYEYRAPSAAPEPEKLCPRCAEHVKAAANVCRFCGHEFDTPSPA